MLPFYAGVLIAWTWLAVTSVHLYRHAALPLIVYAEDTEKRRTNMRYLMLLSGTNPATPPPPELFEAIMKLGGEATQAGVLLDTAGLLPSAAGTRVAWRAAR